MPLDRLFSLQRTVVTFWKELDNITPFIFSETVGKKRYRALCGKFSLRYKPFATRRCGSPLHLNSMGAHTRLHGEGTASRNEPLTCLVLYSTEQVSGNLKEYNNIDLKHIISETL